MFAKDKVSKSIIDAVNSVINEDEKKRMLLEPEIDETGFHKAAHAAKKASQTHFEFQGKKYPVTAKSQKEESSKMERVLSDNGMGGIVKTEKPILPKDSFKKKLKESLTKTKERDFSDFMVNEKEMSPGQMKKREDIVMSMKDKTSYFKKKYGKDWKNVMYATATKQAMAKEEVELSEKNESHTHAAHYENDKGEWTGMNLLVAKNDQDAIKQAHEKCKEGCRLSRVERHIPVKEEVEQIDELKKSTLASYAKKAGDESSYYSFAAGSRSAKDPQRLVSDKLAMKRLSGVNKAVDRLAKEDVQLDEEGMKDALKKFGKKTFKALTGGSDEDQLKALQRRSGAPVTGKKPVQKEEALDMKTLTLDTLKGREKLPKGKTHDNEHTAAKVNLKAEGWDDMLKSVADRHKPQPSGGSGVKQGSRYGGSKQKEKPEQEEPKEKMKEGKDPSMDAGVGSSPNFVTDESKPLKNAKELARNTMKKIKTEMLGKISN
jgi:hypothetical protein